MTSVSTEEHRSHHIVMNSSSTIIMNRNQMNSTTSSAETWKKLQSFLLVTSIPVHLLNILSVLLTRNLLKQKAYVIFVNLSFSDLLAALTVVLRNFFISSLTRVGSFGFNFMTRCCFLASTLFTCCITMDRYDSFVFNHFCFCCSVTLLPSVQ